LRWPMWWLALLHIASADPDALSGYLTYLTFALGTFDVQLGALDLATNQTQALYTFPSEIYESAYWVESSLITGSTWISNVQYVENETQGALLEYDFKTKALITTNATYCWAVFVDVRDPTGNTLLCVADNAVNSRARRGLTSRGLSHSSQKKAMPTNRGARQVRVVTIDRLTGKTALVGAFPEGLEEDLGITYDTRRNVIWAMLMTIDLRTVQLWGFDVASGKPLPNPAVIPRDHLYYCFQYDSVTDMIVGVASTFDASRSAWNTGFGSISTTDATFSPIGAVNGTFAVFRQFNDIDAIASAQGVFFLTCFDWVLPDTTLYVVGVHIATGQLVAQIPVRNPFVDISFVPSVSLLSTRMDLGK